MFNFTTQTIFNSVIKTTPEAIKARTAPKGYNVIVSANPKKPELRIGNTRFTPANVIDVQVKKHTPEHLAKVTFNMADALTKIQALVGKDTNGNQLPIDGTYRIILYVGLSMNCQDSFYSNDFVYKGKPLFIEFPIKTGDTGEIIAKKMVKIAEKYMLFTTDTKILNVYAEGGSIVFEGVNGYQLLKKAILQRFDPEANPIDCCINQGAFVDVIKGVPVSYTQDLDTGEVTLTDKVFESDGLRDLADDEIAIEPGLEAFGDYNWLVHNLRLPTLANTYFWTVNKSEMPVVGGQYTQFIIRMCVDRDGIAGGVLGQRATTVTTHVLYVLDQGQNVATIEQALAGFGTKKTDADDTLAEPYANAE